MKSLTPHRWAAVSILSVAAVTVSLAGPRANSQAGTVPLTADPVWKQIRTTDVAVVSDADETVMRRAAVELEGFRRAIAQLAPAWRATSLVPTRLVLFKDQQSFDAYRPRDANGRKRDQVIGYFAERPHVNYMVTFVQPGRRLDLSTILHEYTHFLASRNLHTLPTWLNEGLAEFYSTFESGDDGGAIVGRVPSGRLQTLRRGGTLLLEQVLRPGSASRLVRNSRTAPTFYAQSWALVHYLMVGHERQRDGQLAAYLSHIAQGRSLDQAFADAFHTSYGELQLELSIYTLRAEFPAMKLAASGGQFQSVVRPISERDALQMRGDILAAIGAWPEAEAMLAKARTLDARFGPTQMSLGLVHIGRQRPAAARDVLDRATRANDSDFGLHFYLGSVLLEQGEYAGAARELSRATELVPDSAPAWFRLSVARLTLGDREGSDEALQNATAADARPAWSVNRARAVWPMGLDAVVLDDVASAAAGQQMDAETAAYAALLAAASSWRLRQPELAAPLVRSAHANTDEGTWTRRVLDFASNQIDGNTLIRTAVTNGELTEARAYVGLRAALAGRTREGRPHLVWVRDRGNKDYVEYAMATTVLKELDAASR